MDTRERILLAAKELFVKKGFDAVRMSEIAILAQVNKSSLHYYFRSKEKLFETVLDTVLINVAINIVHPWSENVQISHKIKKIVSNYIDFISEDPQILLFVINELSLRPARIIEFYREFCNRIWVDESLYKESQIEDFNRINLIINMLSLCTFPFICESAICQLFFDNNKEEYNSFLKRRKEEITTLLIQSINQQ